jgi:hypothetical protein
MLSTAGKTMCVTLKCVVQTKKGVLSLPKAQHRLTHQSACNASQPGHILRCRKVHTMHESTSIASVIFSPAHFPVCFFSHIILFFLPLSGELVLTMLLYFYTYTVEEALRQRNETMQHVLEAEQQAQMAHQELEVCVHV